MAFTLHLIQVDPSRPAAVARGIRDCLRSAGMEPGPSIHATQEIAEKALNGELPQPLVHSEDAEAIERADSVLTEASRGAATGGKNLSDNDLREVQIAATVAGDETAPEDARFTRKLSDDEPVSRSAALTLAVLFAYADGKIVPAFNLARSLARTTGDSALYEEVCRCVVTAFDIQVSE
jgi:hypothetical protein